MDHPVRSHLQLLKSERLTRERPHCVLRVRADGLRRDCAQRGLQGQRRLVVPTALDKWRHFSKRHRHCTSLCRQARGIVFLQRGSLKQMVCETISDLATAAKPRAIPDYDYDKKIGQVI